MTAEAVEVASVEAVIAAAVVAGAVASEVSCLESLSQPMGNPINRSQTRWPWWR